MVKVNFIICVSVLFVAICLDLSSARRPYFSDEDETVENLDEGTEETSVPQRHTHRPVRRLQSGATMPVLAIDERTEEPEPEDSQPTENEELESEAPEPEAATPRMLVDDRSVERNEVSPVISNEPVACTCGIFMTGQFQKTSKAPPKGNPIVMTEMEETFQCNPAGKKQCVNKCLEILIKHLPNSPALICAAADRDIHKERAYLFVKNCEDEWQNSNLSAGREYCCKDSEIIKCPSS